MNPRQLEGLDLLIRPYSLILLQNPRDNLAQAPTRLAVWSGRREAHLYRDPEEVREALQIEVRIMLSQRTRHFMGLHPRLPICVRSLCWGTSVKPV